MWNYKRIDSETIDDLNYAITGCGVRSMKINSVFLSSFLFFLCLSRIGCSLLWSMWTEETWCFRSSAHESLMNLVPVSMQLRSHLRLCSCINTASFTGIHTHSKNQCCHSPFYLHNVSCLWMMSVFFMRWIYNGKKVVQNFINQKLIGLWKVVISYHWHLNKYNLNKCMHK